MMKKANLNKSAFILIISILLSSYFTIYAHGQINLNSYSVVSNYTIPQSVTYQVELNYTLTHTRISPQMYYFKVARLNDRQPNSSLTQHSPPYQLSELVYNSITGYDSLALGSLDKFNNTYDLFNASLSYMGDTTITLSQKYIITLNEVSFGSILSSDIGPYDTSDPMFDLYCNNSEQYYERNEPDLINASNSIVDALDNPLEKARKISSWISSYLIYDGSLPAEEKGALWAYNNKRGDCSEYSTLMITLLRIQGIPARKVTGFLLSSNTGIKPDVGQVFNFYANSMGSTNILGHAWVEYYIPNIGWIACEPQNPQSYKKIDYIRFNLNVGAWFFMPGATPPFNFASEFPHIPSPVCADHDAYDFDFDLKITVLDTNYIGFDFLVLVIIIGIIASVAIIIVLGMRSGKKRKKEINSF